MLALPISLSLSSSSSSSSFLLFLVFKGIALNYGVHTDPSTCYLLGPSYPISRAGQEESLSIINLQGPKL